MKKKNKKNQIRMRFSTILLCCLAIVLCTAPSVCGEDYFGLYYDEVGEYDVTVDEINKARGEAGLEKNGVLYWLDVGSGTIVNLYASVEDCVYVYPGGILNIYSGSVGWYIIVSPPSPDETNAVVTVYGTEFAVSNGTIQPDGNWTPDSSGTLTGYYGGGDGSSIEGDGSSIDGDGSSINLWIFSDTPINLQPPPSSEEIQIDIKPGGNPNNINLKSKGVVPVAVLTTDDFNASNVDPDTVKFAGASHVRWTMEDVDNDGDKDMLFHFKTQDLLKSENNPDGLDEDSTEATLTGTTFGGEDIELTDEVWIVPGKKK